MRVLFSKGFASISKPRCGSTSVRRMLDRLMDPRSDDFSVDIAGQLPPYHPHITAPYLQLLLEEHFPNASELEYITTIRNPVNMLFSYYSFFQPDENSNYNYDPKWLGTVGMEFEKWVLFGRVGSNPIWLENGPRSISVHDLSPLSLEAHAKNRDGENMINHVFRIEDIHELLDWLEKKTDEKVEIKHVNASRSAELPALGSEALDKIRIMFPMESALYSL